MAGKDRVVRRKCTSADAALSTLHDVVRRINAGLDLPTTLQEVVDGVLTLGFGVCVINLATAAGDLEVAAVAGSREARAALLGERASRADWDAMLNAGERWGDLVFLGAATATPDQIPTWVPDREAPTDPEAWHPLDALFAPMAGRAGELVGVLSVDLPADGRRPDARSRELLSLFAAQATFAVENSRAYAEMSQVVQRLGAIVDTAPAAIYETDPQGLVRLWNAGAEELLGWPRAAVLGRPVPGRPRDEPHPTAARPVRRAESVRRRADGRGVVLAVAEALLPGPAGEPGGYLTVAVDITDRKRLEAELVRQATTDALTGLPNRKLFEDRLVSAVARARRSVAPVGVLLVDLDGFKEINDRRGHAVGDEVLIQVAQRIARCTREGDTVARLGGDEFVILLEGSHAGYAAAEVADRIVGAVGGPIEGLAPGLRAGASVGVAVLDHWSAYQDAASAAAELVRRADLAMYAAKAAGKNTARTYAETLSSAG